MIRPLRQRHYYIFVAIGFILPVVFAFGIVARKPFPTMDSSPDNLFGTAQPFLATDWERTDLFAKSPMQVRLLREKNKTESLAVNFSTARDYFIKPDLMVYWIAGNPVINDKLPDFAKLLGGFNSGPLPLPAEAATTNGVLVLYSLADNEIVDVSKPIQFHQPTR
jgi:hypothetical protein